MAWRIGVDCGGTFTDACVFGDESVSQDRRVTRTIDMRYAGHNCELSMPLSEGPVTAATLDAVAEGFAEAHRFAAEGKGEPVQFVTFRAGVAGPAWCFESHLNPIPEAA